MKNHLVMAGASLRRWRFRSRQMLRTMHNRGRRRRSWRRDSRWPCWCSRWRRGRRDCRRNCRRQTFAIPHLRCAGKKALLQIQPRCRRRRRAAFVRRHLLRGAIRIRRKELSIYGRQQPHRAGRSALPPHRAGHRVINPVRLVRAVWEGLWRSRRAFSLYSVPLPVVLPCRGYVVPATQSGHSSQVQCLQ